MINDYIKGAKYALSGLSLIRSKGIRRYVIIPLLINVVLFVAAIFFAANQAEILIEYLLSKVPDWLQWLSWILWLLFAALASIIVFYTFTLVANLIGSPFNSVLAEKLEHKLSGNVPPSQGRFIETFLGVKGAIISELSKFGYLITWAIGLLLLSAILIFIPLLGLLVPVIWFAFGSWMLALEYMDYPMGNHGLLFKEQRNSAQARRGLYLGFGSAVTVMTLIPVLNFFAMPVAVTGATKMWVEDFSQKP